MNVSPRHPLFNQRSTSNVYRVFLWTVLILAGLWLVYGVNTGDIKAIGFPSPTPTRGALSYEAEADTYFKAGELGAAISAYQKAIETDPSDANAWAEMARIQTYSSALKTTDDEKRTVLLAALKSINQAKVLAPDSSEVAAIRAFVLDWNANDNIFPDTAADSLLEAEQEATRARQLDNQNVLALAYNAEILIDQMKLTQGEQLITQALNLGPNQMDVHRIDAYLLESEGAYSDAIAEYDKAIALMPNLTFLYLSAGANYRTLAFRSTIDAQQTDLYTKSLEYFAKAAKINAQLGVEDPIPYLSISKTYSQMGEYFIAGRNVQKALDFKPADPDIYGQLGIVFFKSRNYEGAVPALQCAVRGCTPDQSCDARYGDNPCKPDLDEVGVEVKGLPLSQNTVVYYYTYGSVMASLSRPQKNYCPDAMKVFQEVQASFSTDPIIMGIVQDGETICRSIGQPTSTPLPFMPGGMITPAPTATSALTATPAPQTR
jgi:tetratricopeptide (TPR) repeat protein